MIDDIMVTLGLTKASTLGGFLGAVVSLKFIDNLNWWQRVTTVLGGMISAAYVAPLIIVTFNLTPKVEGAVSFLVGLFGMSIVAAAIKIIPDVVQAAKDKWVSK